ncbi:MAG: nitrogenase-stabilizing/protective protein NifW [Candidatus Thiodiazotropha sp. 6PLUC2]
MSDSEFDLDMDELSSAEDFLEYFNIDFDASVVHVNRLHILQRFHDYLDGVEQLPESDVEKYELYAGMLKSAYSDFVESNALTEKVFKVFHMHEPVTVKVPLMDLSQQVDSFASKV